MTAKQQAVIAAIGAVIVIAILVLVGIHGVSNLYIIPAGTFDPSYGTDNQTGKAPADIRAAQTEKTLAVNDSLYSGEIVLASYGNRNRTAWIDSTHATSFDPSNFSSAVRMDMEPYLYPDGPVIGYGFDITGTIVIMYYENRTVNRTLTDEMYSRIAAKGKDYGFEQIPCRVILTGMVQSDIAKDTVTSRATERIA